MVTTLECPEFGRCGAMCTCDLESSRSKAAPMVITRQAVDQLIEFEIGSEAAYQQRHAWPHWPGGGSGVTIGFGYDLGYQDAETFAADWRGLLPPQAVERLGWACGRKGQKASRALLSVQDILVPLASARRVFAGVALPRYAKRTQQAFPGVEQLPPLAQGMLLSLVYNRGHKVDGSDRRREMLAIRALVPSGNLEAIADQFESMARLWPGPGLRGLALRRQREAQLIRAAELVTLAE